MSEPKIKGNTINQTPKERYQRLIKELKLARETNKRLNKELNRLEKEYHLSNKK